ncbi:MAG: ATP-binding protein [Prevotella sp.]|uniref:AAA family ATPase n=1 Tax=Prevotella sp. TaxID=59823 RepID=UPI002A3535DF|nr:ATP-binding protein [Prevotella sp.]MDD7318590.1 ATP-binding protein [Prevotellaceae bacterium]MDY4020391.1 ATP-binding protein [Prevotella sp.]
MRNPFKFGTVVDGEFFTDRENELKQISHLLQSDNHLILISPRRYGKTSLVTKAVKQSGKPYIMLNMQDVVSTEDLSAKLIKEIFKIYQWEHLKHLMTHFRITPTISMNPVNNTINVSFQPRVNSDMVLEDAMSLLAKVAEGNKRLVVVLDEFQEITSIEKGLDKKLRGIMQFQQNINYIFLGSQESMMEEIFEHKKSPFYHFGMLMRLNSIPEDDFREYLTTRMKPVFAEQTDSVTHEIAEITHCHPYYTQQLASVVWELAEYQGIKESVTKEAAKRIIQAHDLDFERLWMGMNKTDRLTMIKICQGENPIQSLDKATSTTYSSLKRLLKNGFIVRESSYDIEDPFFKQWIIERQK